jgi:hypothetical protein
VNVPNPVVIENPILNSPFAEPARHYRFDAADNITDEIADGRLPSCYFVPIAAPRKRGKQTLFDGLPADERRTESDHVNRVQAAVRKWRDLGYLDVTPTTRGLLDHWAAPDRTRRLFFCQVEALETLIYVAEVAKQTKHGETWIEGHLRDAARAAGRVPFKGFPCAGVPAERAAPTARRGDTVRAVPDRLVGRPWLEITFPRVIGYRYEVPPDRLTAAFDGTHRVALTTEDIPNRVENAPIAGEAAVLTLDHLKDIRPQAVAFKLATHLQQHHFKDRPWLFPQLLGIVRAWLGDPDGDSPNVDYGDETFPGMLLFVQRANEAAEKIFRAIQSASGGAQRLRAELPETDRAGTTADVAYDTVKTVWRTDPARCHLNLVPEDSGWETAVVGKLEHMPEVLAYVKNQGLGFRIPYTFEGRPGNYFPDLIVTIEDGRGADDPLHLIVEVSGQEKRSPRSSARTTRRNRCPPCTPTRISPSRPSSHCGRPGTTC